MDEAAIPIFERQSDRLAYAAAFTPALLDPRIEAPSLVAGPRGKPVKKRYDVYRNNVIVSLVNALADTFPATQRIVGEDFFRAMARLYVRQHPPTSPLLFEYGRDFADFIAGFEPARMLPYLADVAYIERAWLDSYHAADTAPLRAETLKAMRPEELHRAVFTAHPAAHVVRSRFPAVTIFAINRQNGPSGRLEAREPEEGLISRPELTVFVRRLPPGGAVFLESLMSGKPLGKAVEAALEENVAFDPAANIAGMIEAGAFTDVKASGG